MMRLFQRMAFSRIIKPDRFTMTPHEYWIACGKGMERPYTGEYWFTNEVGTYHCKHCEQKLFKYDAKYKSTNGYATFWNHILNSVKLEESDKKDERDLCCSDCNSFLGKVTFDGPFPTFIKYSINSSALSFKLQEWQTDPYQKKLEKKKLKEERKAQSLN